MVLPEVCGEPPRQEMLQRLGEVAQQAVALRWPLLVRLEGPLMAESLADLSSTQEPRA